MPTDDERLRIRRLEAELEDALARPPRTPEETARLAALQWRWTKARFDYSDGRASKVDWKTVLSVAAVTAAPVGTVIAALITTSS